MAEAFANPARALALLLCQQGRGNEAVDLLRDLGFTWRLSNEVLHYPLDDINGNPTTSSPSTAAGIVEVVDDALPHEMIEHLQHVFCNSSPFWREHHYDPISSASRSVGYFSYLYPFRQHHAQCSVEAIMDRLLSIVSGIFPRVATECQFSKCFTIYLPQGYSCKLNPSKWSGGCTRDPTAAAISSTSTPTRPASPRA